MSKSKSTKAKAKIEKAQSLPGRQLVPSGAHNIDVEHFLVDSTHNLKINMDLAKNIIAGNITRTMDAASTLSVTVHDPDKILLSSALWDYSLDVEMNGMWFRLVQTSKDGDDVTLVFEDRVIAWMRSKKKPLKVSRGSMTRAEFVQKMVKEIEADNKAGFPLHFFSPELHKKQPVASADKQVDDLEARQTKEKGIQGDKVEGTGLSPSQVAQAERLLRVGDSLKAPYKAMIAVICAALGESDLGDNPDTFTPNYLGFWGVLQGSSGKDKRWPAYFPDAHDTEAFAHAFFKGGKGFQGGGAIALSAISALSVGGMVTRIEGSGEDGSYYGKFEPIAKKVVSAFGTDANDTATTSVTSNVFKPYPFMRGKPDGPLGENTYQAATRLAAQVRWRFFVVGTYVYFVPDRDLISSKAILSIHDENQDADNDEGILTVNFDVDAGKPVNEATLTARADRWFADPGEVVILGSKFGPAAGRWLISRIERDLFEYNATITLRKPQDPKKEPAPTLTSYTRPATKYETGSKALPGGTDPNSYGPVKIGKVSMASGAERAGVSTNKWVIEFLQIVAGLTSENVVITTGTNHNQYVKGSRNESDHWTGNAADLAFGADAPSRGSDLTTLRKGANIATAALKVLQPFNKTLIVNPRDIANTEGQLAFQNKYNWVHNGKSYHCQVGWRTNVGGDHYNHVHIGVSPN